ncbi:MAG: Tn3 family transposase [Betaproteobacteria bacterium]
MAKMRIFNASEQKIFESAPIFNSVERKRFFTLPLALNESIENLRTPTNKVCFLVAVGYFKARNRFFTQQFYQADIEFISKQIGVNPEDVKPKTYKKETYRRHQKLILDYFGFSSFDELAVVFAKNEISLMVRVHFRPKLILLEIVQVLTYKKIALPSYNVLAVLIIEAITQYQKLLNQTIIANLDVKQQKQLDALLEKVTGTGSNDKWRYQITLLKKPSQSIQPAKIKENVTDLNSLLAIYLKFKPVITHLGLSYECLRYYAYSVIKSQIHQVSRRAEDDRYLHLLAFISYQTLKLQDMLIDTMLLAVQATINSTTKEHQERYYNERESREKSVNHLVDGLQKGFLGTIATIKIIIANAELTSDQKVTEIAATVNRREVKKAGIKQQINDFKADLKTIQDGTDYYDLLENRSIKLQNRVAEIVRQTIFDSNCGNPLLYKAILHYQKKSGDIDKNAPMAFLTPEQSSLIFNNDGKFRISLYKALFYIAVADAIKSGVLNLIHSEKYRSLDDYMIPKADWNEHLEEYLQRAQLTEYADCKKTLIRLDQEVDRRYKETNNNFITGSNAYLTFRANGTFHVSTPKLEDTDSAPLSGVFPDRKYIPLLEALATVDNATGLIEEFEHWQTKYRHTKPAKKVFFAGIMAYGCDIGHRKLAQISKQINETELDNAINWYFSLDNVRATNDRVLQYMDRMEAPNIYRNQDDLLHTSSDGQKFGVSVDSLNANYSFKYLGKDKGVSVMSFIDMRQMIWYSNVVSSAEREAAYVIDGLMYNDVIKSDIHSTDTHGFSEVIFAVLYLLGFIFAPRIKGLGRQKLYAFINRKMTTQETDGFKPHKYINEDIIEPQWDEILRFVATIKLKVTTASQLFRRLNSYSKQHPLYKALKEFGKIPKTLFILKYADDPQFRQSIEKQLNKVEGSHKLTKAISLGNDHAFLQGDKGEQEIAEGCRRLIKNVLMCWNYLYLSKELKEETDGERRQELIEVIKNDSVMRWSHFNLGGEYDFSDEKMVDSVGLESPKKKPTKNS